MLTNISIIAFIFFYTAFNYEIIKTWSNSDFLRVPLAY